MTDRNKIIRFCEDYLKVKDFHEDCCNGLQVEGTKEIEKIVLGVSWSQKLIQAAIKKNAQMIMVHHGLFFDQIDNPPKIGGYIANRLKLLMVNNINLIGFHLPLDTHPIIGNNISLCRLFGVKSVKPFDVGFVGEINKEISFKKFQYLVDSKLGIRSSSIAAGNNFVKRVGVISGGASPEFKLAKALGADTYITGDIRESVVEAINESEINFICAGHYNTEKLGIQNLGKLLAKKFRIKTEFVDIPCDI